MYKPDFFNETDQDEINRLIDSHPLAALVAHTPTGLVASHLPLIKQGDTHIIGHIALKNTMHQDVPDGSEVMAIFSGESSYISPNWYPSKPEHHRFVPTWNYQAVHVYGAIRFDHSEKFKRMAVGRLTTRFERETNGDEAWRMADAPADYMAMMLENIVAFEIAITRVEATSKLSQNRAPIDRENVRNVMETSGKAELALRMTKTQK
ncbi:FMN-binding negative transcriptional regulator [Rhizobium sp. L1K21]|uniref:FMN-binding negative transcriptional regulator n=1 Tax=Rhizobium sp. L1K21 TaxID=2954933 RepID=UPI0020924931|nr:FMN-binding negative transcriptional regulator [Rhizobium sp. L1K21]MCO6185854.1 FMN-binding negative transcriptional regulator [Rhizobium sp. L1K21]